MTSEQIKYRTLMAELIANHSENEACVARCWEILDGKYDEQPPQPRWGNFMMYIYAGDYENAIIHADPLNYLAFAAIGARPNPDEAFFRAIKENFACRYLTEDN